MLNLNSVFSEGLKYNIKWHLPLTKTSVGEPSGVWSVSVWFGLSVYGLACQFMVWPVSVWFGLSVYDFMVGLSSLLPCVFAY